MGVKIKKEVKAPQRMKHLEVKYNVAVPLLGIANTASMIYYLFVTPAEVGMGWRVMFVLSALAGIGFAYWGFNWKIISDSKQITIKPLFGAVKNVNYSDIKQIEVHKKKYSDHVSFYLIQGESGQTFVKVYSLMTNCGELLTRLDRLGIKLIEVKKQ